MDKLSGLKSSIFDIEKFEYCSDLLGSSISLREKITHL